MVFSPKMSRTVICRWGWSQTCRKQAGKGGTVGRQSSKAGGHCRHRRNGRSYRWANLVAKQARKEGGWTRLAGQARKGNLRHSRQTLTLSFMDILPPTHLSTATGQTQTPSSYTLFVCTFSKLKTHNMIHSVFLYKQHTTCVLEKPASITAKQVSTRFLLNGISLPDYNMLQLA